MIFLFFFKLFFPSRFDLSSSDTYLIRRFGGDLSLLSAHYAVVGGRLMGKGLMDEIPLPSQPMRYCGKVNVG